MDEVLRHDGLGDFLGQTSCSSCHKHDGIFKCKCCSNGRLLKCLDCTLVTHQTLPLHRVEVSLLSPDTKSSADCSFLARSGMGCFSSRRAFKALVFATNSATLGHPALVLKLARKTSSSSTSRALIISQSITVDAATNPYQIGPSYYANNGFLPRYHARNQFSRSNASKRSTSSLYKERRTCTTITTPFFACPTMRTCRHPL